MACVLIAQNPDFNRVKMYSAVLPLTRAAGRQVGLALQPKAEPTFLHLS